MREFIQCVVWTCDAKVKTAREACAAGWGWHLAPWSNAPVWRCVDHKDASDMVGEVPLSTSIDQDTP